MYVPYAKTITVQGTKFTIESEISSEFVDRWINFLKKPSEPHVESRTHNPFLSLSDPPFGCEVLPTKGGRMQ